MTTPVGMRRNVSSAARFVAGEELRAALISTAAVTAALLLVLLDAPVLMRSLVALPVLVLVPGRSAVALLVGRLPWSETDREEGTDVDPAPETGVPFRNGVDDPLIRTLLAVVLGMLFLLATALTVAVLGLRIDTVSIAIGASAGSLGLLGAAYWRHRRVPPGRAPGTSPSNTSLSRPTSSRLRHAFGVLAGIAVLVAALIGARAMQTTPVEKYTAISFDDPRMLQPDPLTAVPGAAVTLTWTLRSYGRSLTDNDGSVVLTVGSAPASGQSTHLGPVRAGDGGDASGATSEQSGSATFSAPETSGAYRVDVTVTSGGAPYVLETHLEVTG